MTNDRLLVIFALLIAGAIYLNVTHTQLPQGLRSDHPVSWHHGSKHIVSGSLDNYPDVIARLTFDDTPADTVIQQINSFKDRYAAKHKAWLSELTLDTIHGDYVLGADFQIAPYSEATIRELTDSIYLITGQQLQYIQLE